MCLLNTKEEEKFVQKWFLVKCKKKQNSSQDKKKMEVDWYALKLKHSN